MKKKLVIILVFMLVALIIIPSATTNILENVNKPNNIKSFDDVDWWPMYGHDPQHTGFSTSLAPNLKMVKWSYNIGSFGGLILIKAGIKLRGRIYCPMSSDI